MLPWHSFCCCCWAGWLSRISVVKPERSGCRARVFSISPPVGLFVLLQIPLTLPGQQPCGHASSRPPPWTSDCRGVVGEEWGLPWWGRPASSHLSLKATPKLSAVCPALHREGRRRGETEGGRVGWVTVLGILIGKPSGGVDSHVC